MPLAFARSSRLGGQGCVRNPLTTDRDELLAFVAGVNADCLTRESAPCVFGLRLRADTLDGHGLIPADSALLWNREKVGRVQVSSGIKRRLRLLGRYSELAVNSLHKPAEERIGLLQGTNAGKAQLLDETVRERPL